MTKRRLPKLTFPSVRYGRQQTPWDLTPLLYRGGAAARANLVEKLIVGGSLGEPVSHRLPLVRKLHSHIEGQLAGGGSRGTAEVTIRRLRDFFAWADSVNKEITVTSVETVFIEWSEYLIDRQRTSTTFGVLHAYQCAVAVGKSLDCVLDLRTGMLSRTRLRRPRKKTPILGTEADKQNLTDTFAFGNALLDIASALTVETIRGELPASITFRDGRIIEVWTKLRPPERLLYMQDNYRPSMRRLALEKREAWQADTSMRTRHSLVNMRIEAEMLIFIAQSGMNLEQANSLRACNFRYRSHLDGYQVYRVYKGRRQGEVEFQIFSAYREHFECYLEWRASMFPDDDEGLLFPFVLQGRTPEATPHFSAIAKTCEKLSIHFIRPRALRKTRINWLLRRSRDPALTAEMHAHSQETLIRIYEQPSLQIAMVEISRFHAKSDPMIWAAGPGVCAKGESFAEASVDTPSDATQPDCISAAGCLFCRHQRDIDSADHVWSLASYRYLKILELSGSQTNTALATSHPAALAIERLTAKLQHLEGSNQARALWVHEALARVQEGNHHSRWEGFIRLMEIRG